MNKTFRVLCLTTILSLMIALISCQSNVPNYTNNQQQTNDTKDIQQPEDKDKDTESVETNDTIKETELVETENTVKETEPVETENTVKETELMPSPETDEIKLDAFNKQGAIEETILVDDFGVKITATALEYGGYSADLKLTIENTSDKELDVLSGTTGYCCNSINGYMVESGYLYSDVSAGKKAVATISFSYNDLMLYGITEIADISLSFEIRDDNYDSVYTGARQLKTSLYDSHDYDEDFYYTTITSQTAVKKFGYSLIYKSQDVLYDVDGIKLVSSCLITNKNNDKCLLLEYENTTDKTVILRTSNIAINNLKVRGYNWTSNFIDPDKHLIVSIDLSSALESEYWDVFGITEVGSVSLSVAQLDAEYNDLSNDVVFEISVSETSSELNDSGYELYNANDVQVVLKTVMDEPGSYSNIIHIFMIATNNSGRKLSLDCKYDSLSINGFMVDESCLGLDIENGQSGILDLYVFKSNLKDINVKTASEIAEFEFTLEIKEGWTTIDESTVSAAMSEMH